MVQHTGGGEVFIPSANEDISFQVDAASAEILREWLANTGALVCGRRLFEITNGWGENHPIGAPIVVVTHRVPDDADRWKRTTFVGNVAEGIEEATRIADDRDISVASAAHPVGLQPLAAASESMAACTSRSSGAAFIADS